MKPVNFAGLNKCFLRAGFLLITFGTGIAGLAQAQSSADFAAIPPLITESAPPNVMLVMSDDHELYKKAYSDFSDINGDGLVDTSYRDDFTYSGYFNSNFCYTYGAITTSPTTINGFMPGANISASIATSGHSCASVAAKWSGNFLNWASMTRMDIVRDVLFGGRRIVDTAASGATPGMTVLERAFLPEDVHSFVKVFTGTTQNFTPFTQTSISICNTTYGASTNAPLMRVANGKWPLWASSEVVQCHYRDERDSGLVNQPTATDRPAPYNFDAQVQVCVPGMDAAFLGECKAYTSGTGVVTYKPYGLLQQYGDTKAINFGLITGSYNKKIQGGVLRKDIGPLVGNATATKNEVDLTNGTFLNQGLTNAGIINAISRFRIVNWDYPGNVYTDCASYGISKATFMTSTNANRQCINWGNPLSEIYLEALRYFRGDQVASASNGFGVPTAAFNISDAAPIPSLPQLTWTDPLDTANGCASCSIIVLSTGLNSFDKDNLGSVTDLGAGFTTTTLNNLVNKVGDLESITGGSYLIGDNGTTNDENCTAKPIPFLSAARGICPEIGSLEGGFDIAGLAYHAYTADIRGDLAGLQNVSTYSVALAQNLPSYELNVNGKTVTFVPTCKSNSTPPVLTKLDEGGWTNCSFVDAKIESQTATGGSMYIAWEDSLWGNDFDMDGVSRIEWCIGAVTAATVATACPGEVANANYTAGSGQTNFTYNDFAWKTGAGITADTVQFRTSVPLAASGVALKLGFSISGVQTAASEVSVVTNTPTEAMATGTKTTGVTPNVKYIARGIPGNGEQYYLLKENGYTIKRLGTNTDNRIIYHAPVAYTATTAVTAGKVLKNPLYFTAKYGSFNDIDKDGTPKYNNSATDNREWDIRSVNGLEVPDGIPDSFFPITNPNQLRTSLSEIFNIIAARVSSGTAAAVVANSSSGLGSVYQAYYHPEYTDANSTRITWGGVLHSLFFDSSGRFREDNGIAGKLESTSIDYVVDFFYDTSVSPNRTRYKRYVQVSNTLVPVSEPLRDLEDFGSIWNARDVLAEISQADIIQQRAVSVSTNQYSEDAGNKRYIFTYVDSPTSGTPGVVDAGEVVDFTHANFDSTNATINFRYLGLGTPSEAVNLVKYIRGQDVSGWRSRLVDIPGDGTTTAKYWVLGDIVHSSPLVVSPPNMRYDTVNGDDTYTAFKEQYQRRRQIIYTGGNDGMLHAFNAGVWAPELQEFKTQNYDTVSETYTAGQSHKLGAEMWAYVPMNLLPHLQWLKEPSYPHVYYMDAPPQSFDVNIFSDDATHPNGWGTILVVGMRLGGGDLPVDLDGNGVKETTMHSAIVILDITDPEQAPTLLAEINGAGLGFTTSMPALAKVRTPSASGSYANPTENNWMLVFGSGPDDLDSVTSTTHKAKMFAYDLRSSARTLVTVASQAQPPGAEPVGFFGDLRTVDWDNDFVDDVIFGGTVEGTEAAPSGRMKRIVLSDSSVSLGLGNGTATMSNVMTMGKPVIAAPNIQLSIPKNEKWLLFGTGRLFTSLDNRSTTQQSFYGIKEANSYATTPPLVAESALVNSTKILVQKNGNIWRNNLVTKVVEFSTQLNTYNELYTFMDTRPGWKKYVTFTGTNPSERVFTSTLIVGSSAIFTSYLPSPDLCTVEGNSFLYAVNFRTGTAEKYGPLGKDPAYADPNDVDDDDNDSNDDDDDDSIDVIADNIALGTGAASGAVGINSGGGEARLDGKEGSCFSIITTNSTGETNENCLPPPPNGSGRMSWEQLEIPF